MGWDVYRGETYWDWPTLEAWCRSAAEAHGDWLRLETVGESREGRPLLLLTVGWQSGDTSARPALWIDGGTHATEFTGVMATVYGLSRWLEGLSQRDAALEHYFREHTVYAMPCISPDGYQAMHTGSPFIRSSLRPPREGTVRAGFEPQDLDGDGVVRWMRWKHPAGPFVADPEVPMFMRHRTLDDDPEEAYFLCDEGLFLHWDGVRWADAPARFGIDLNRNFPSGWQPFSMFGMDSGAYALSEPETRAVIDAVHARSNIAAAITNHTYTGCILTQPYRDPSPLDNGDIRLMEALAQDAVEGTPYKVYRVHPDFRYDMKKDIVGVWADTLSTVLGIPGYTVELWNPYGHAGLEVEKPALFFAQPDPEIIRGMIAKFCEDEGAYTPWRSFEHPQLGPVEIGGIDYLRTVRNPPEALLAKELAIGQTIADRMRRALPSLKVEVTARALGEDTVLVVAVFTNLGFLPTSGLGLAERLGQAPGIAVELQLPEGAELIQGAAEQSLGHLDGWGNARVGAGRHAIYAGLGGRGPHASVSWVVRGSGAAILSWVGKRCGRGTREITLG